MLIFFLVLPFFYALVQSATLVCKHFYSLSNNYKVWESIRDKYALVTNATSDVGEALCMQLAEKGIKLIITGPSEDQLIALKKRLIKKVVVEHHVVDFCHCSDFTFLEKYDIGLLINKIGFVDSKPAYFINQNIDKLTDLYIRGPFNLMKAVLISMTERHKGYVVNIGFAYSVKPRPHFSLKNSMRLAYRSWSESMYYEMMPFNVNVEYMDTGEIRSESSGSARPSLFCPSAKDFATSAINTLGSSYFSIPYFPHLIEYISIVQLPASIVARVRSSFTEHFTRKYQDIN